MAASSEKPAHGLLSAELRDLRSEGDASAFRAGEVIFNAGEPGDGFYLVESGRVSISAVVGGNAPRTLASIGPNDYFGEMAVLDDAPRSATATAEVDTTVLFIRREKLLELLERRPQFALTLIREFSARMRALNARYLDEILQAERLAAIGQFAGTIVHDFKNPLTVISMASEIACFDAATPAMRQTAQKRIAHQVDRMTAMLQELIEFTRPSGHQPMLHAGNFALFMLPLAAELTEEMAARRVNVVLQDPPPAVDVRLNPQRLSRLFYNLVGNAADEMRGGGTVFLRFAVTADELRIEVEDTGKGISPEILPALFRPFATHGKTHGTGLGLSICKRIVEDHGGRIWAESAPQKGATFVITLPLADASRVSAPARAVD